MRVDKLQPHKTYKMLSIFGGTGEGIYTVDAPIKTTEVINKLHEVNFTVDGVKDKAMVSEYVEFVEVVLRAKIEQPEGIKYMIQDSFYTKAQAQEYIDMLIEKSEDYIEKKKGGISCAPLMTVDSLEEQLINIRNFKIVEFYREVS